jgi:SAM-dependent methyltransferase
MFRQEAMWIEKVLKSIKPLSGNCLAANFGSSTTDFRLVLQPHIHQYVITTLEKNNWQVKNIDFKNDIGVDIVADLTNPSIAKEYADYFGLTICTNMLEHVENINITIKNLFATTKSDGYILLTVPYKYKKHLDPIDNMFRPKPIEIYNLFLRDSVDIIASQIITITDKTYYPVKQSKYPLWGYRYRIAFWFGMRHKVSGILLKVKKDVRHNGNI